MSRVEPVSSTQWIETMKLLIPDVSVAWDAACGFTAPAIKTEALFTLQDISHWLARGPFDDPDIQPAQEELRQYIETMSRCILAFKRIRDDALRRRNREPNVSEIRMCGSSVCKALVDLLDEWTERRGEAGNKHGSKTKRTDMAQLCQNFDAALGAWNGAYSLYELTHPVIPPASPQSPSSTDTDGPHFGDTQVGPDLEPPSDDSNLVMLPATIQPEENEMAGETVESLESKDTREEIKPIGKGSEQNVASWRPGLGIDFWKNQRRAK